MTEAPECTEERAGDPSYWWISYDIPPEVWDTHYRYHDQPAPEGMTFAVWRDCNGDLRSGIQVVPEPDWADIETLREQVQAQIDLDSPPVETAPDADPIVGLDLWLWVPEEHWQAIEATDTQGGLSVRVQATPTSLTFETPEGTRVCDGPGLAWTEERHDVYRRQDVDTRGRGNPECTFTFQESSAKSQADGVHHTSVTVEWEFRWWLNGTDRGVFGTVPMTQDLDLTVREYQAVVTDQH